MKKILLLLIIISGATLRFYKLTTIPPSLSHDETAIAYNAYSILKTGKDEYGKPFPILFRSFDDYKLPGMVYSTVPSVALFGRSELAARLPSAIYGMLSIVVMYLIMMQLFPKAALWSSIIFALQPWHINFSRQLFESNGAVFWFMLGTYYLLKSRRKYSNIVYAGIFYVISLYFYYSVRLVIPFVVLLYIGIHWKKMIEQSKTTMLAATVSFFIFLPLGINMFSPGGLERISIVSVANDPNFFSRRDNYIQKIAANPTLINNIIYNRRVALFQTIIENYGKNISPHNLFVTGTGTYGALYPFEIILLLFGFFSLLSLSRFSACIILTWLFSAFLPGALSINQPNTLRTLIAAPAFAILSGLGLQKLLTVLPKKSMLSFYTMTFLITLYIHDFPKFLHAYFVDNPSNNAVTFGDGNKQMVEYVKQHESEYNHIYISGYYWRPYIFFLYWGNVNPSDYQRSGSRERFDKYYFTAASWDTNGIKLMDSAFDPNTLETSGKTLFILNPQEMEVQKKHFREIDSISGRRSNRIFISAIQQ